MRNNHLLPAIVGVATFLLAVNAFPEQTSTMDELRAQHRVSGRLAESITLSNPSQGLELSGLKISEVRTEGEVSGFVSRVLLISPEERPIIVTWVSEPRTGRVMTRLFDEGSEWWMELWLNAGIEAEDGAHAAAIGVSPEAWWNRLDEEEPEPILESLMIRTSGGLVLASTVNVAKPDMGLGDFLGAVRGTHEWRVLANEVPKHFIESIVFLREAGATARSFSSSPGSSRGLTSLVSSPGAIGGLAVANLWNQVIVAVTASLRDAGLLDETGDGGEWSVKTRPGTHRLDLGVEASDDLELATKFRSIDPVDPLPEQEVSELLVSVRDTTVPRGSQVESDSSRR